MMSRHNSSRVRRRTIKRRFKLGPTIGRIVAIMAIVVLAVIALTQSAGKEASVYQLTDVRGQQSSADQEVSELQMLAERAQTLDKISQSEVKNSMVPATDNVQYLNDQPGVAGASTTR